MGAKGCENPNAQGVTDRGGVTGTLVDAAHPTQPIASATIQIGTQVTRITPSDGGKFTLNDVPTGTQTIVDQLARLHGVLGVGRRAQG